MRRATILGTAAIGLAVAFNIPYAILAATYDYPAVLRGPHGVALDSFAALGSSSILTWHGFALAAFAFAPLAVALAITADRLRQRPGLAITAAITGALGGFAQAVGLWRWVFVVPGLARRHADPSSSPAVRAAAENAFDLLNAYGGIAIGEHLGQSLTALFVALMAILQWQEGRRVTPMIGALTAAAIWFGTNEGVALALGGTGELFGLATIIGFLGLTGWLIATGTTLIRNAATG